MDKKTGRFYYVNRATKKTTWAKPAGFADDEARVWKQKVDKKTMRAYYVNTVTKKTTWKRPAEASIVGAAGASAATAVAASAPSRSSGGGGGRARVHISRSGSVDIDGATRLNVGRRRGGAESSASLPSAEAVALAERNVELWGAGGDEQARVVIPRIHWAMEGSDTESDGESVADFAALERKYIDAALRRELLAASDSEEEA